MEGDSVMNIMTVVVMVALACSACSSSSGGSNQSDSGSPEESADAAVAHACGVANQPPETVCPAAPAGMCSAGVCNLKSLPSGMACSGDSTCMALIDPCADLAANSDTDYYACDCLNGHWACGLCAPGGATCLDAGGPSGAADAGAEGSP